MTRPAPTRVDDALLAGWPLPAPAGDGDKESRGRVLVVAGSREMPGAALLAATAALRAGAGKLAIATPASVAQAIAMAMPEARVLSLPESDQGGALPASAELIAALADQTCALLVGPGMQDRDATVDLVAALLPRFRHVPVVLDALAMDAVPRLQPFTQPVVLTPHAGEMAHLTGHDKEALLDTPDHAAARHAGHWGGVVVLKGATTCISDGGRCEWLHEAQVPGLGTSGSGDVLAGVLAGLLARGASPAQAAVWAVALHARAGQRLADRQGEIGYLARELAREVPALLQALAAR